MKYGKYEKYAATPNIWLDVQPTHWDTCALRWLTTRYSGGTPDKSNDAYWENGTIPWLNSGAVNDGLITQPSELITHDAFANSSAKWIPSGALVMALAGQGKTKGLVAQLAIRTTCNQSMAAIIPNERILPRYLYWWLGSNYQNIRNMAGGDARDGLNLDMLGDIPCPLPPLSEQQSIARFLDAKTAQIDTLVAKKRQLIERLKEKRQALITQAVTRGLDAKAQLVDSGVDWLGKIPKGWEVKKLGHLCKKIGSGKTPSGGADSYESTGIVFIRSQNVYDDGLRLNDVVFINEDTDREMANTRVQEFDVLLNITGASIGRTCIVPAGFCRANVNQHVCIIRLYNHTMSSYISWVLKSTGCKEQVSAAQNGAAREGLNFDQISKFVISLPPANEQATISVYLDSETKHFDALIVNTETAIARLTEYRQALITSAVTGKIDVRKVAL